MGILFDKISRIILVESPATEVTCQELLNAIRNWEDEPHNMEVPKVAEAVGKDDLGGGLAVGITLKLLNWRVKFADRAGPDTILCSVTGGNLIAVDTNNQPMNPIAPSAYTTITKEVAVSAVRIADVAEWTEDEKTELLTHITTKTDETQAEIAATKGEVLIVRADLTMIKEPLTAKSYNREEDSLAKISDKLDELAKATPIRRAAFKV